MTKFLPTHTYLDVFSNYIPRLCVDIALIGPDGTIEPISYTKDFSPIFKLDTVSGVALVERSENPKRGQWGMAGGYDVQGRITV